MFVVSSDFLTKTNQICFINRFFSLARFSVPAQSAPMSTLQRAQGHVDDVTRGVNTMHVGGWLRCDLN